jgi:putative hydrolase of the HAD superfamily
MSRRQSDNDATLAIRGRPRLRNELRLLNGFTLNHLGERAVFFDAVGTLLYPVTPPAETYAEAALRQGVTLDPELVLSRFRTAFRVEEEADRAAGWVTNEPREVERWRRIVAASLPELPDPGRGFTELFAHFARPDAWGVRRDAGRILAELDRRGVVLGIGSNLDSRLLGIVAGHDGLKPVARRVVVSAAVGYRKPSPRFFEAVVRAAGCAAGDVVFVGDEAVNDFAGATAAGMRAILTESLLTGLA